MALRANLHSGERVDLVVNALSLARRRHRSVYDESCFLNYRQGAVLAGLADAFYYQCRANAARRERKMCL